MAEDDNPNGGRISVSRDALRAELAGLELRLVNRITDEIGRKADALSVVSLERRVVALEKSSDASRVLEDSRREEKKEGLSTLQTLAISVSTLVSTIAISVSGFIWLYYHHHA